MTQATRPKKGIYGKFTGAARPPAPGSPLFAGWRKLTELNTWVYRRTGGRIGGSMDGAPVLLLHHTGRKSGEHRVSPLLYLPDGEDWVIAASYGGAPRSPAWFHNLKAAPDTEIEVRGETIPVRATITGEPERSELYERLIMLYPAFGDYTGKTDRVIPVVRLTRRG